MESEKRLLTRTLGDNPMITPMHATSCIHLHLSFFSSWHPCDSPGQKSAEVSDVSRVEFNN